jgi:hypothetical protein
MHSCWHILPGVLLIALALPLHAQENPLKIISEANDLRDASNWQDAREKYAILCDDASRPDQNRGDHALCDLNYGSLIENWIRSGDEFAPPWTDARRHYERAYSDGIDEQKALAANNIAFLLLRQPAPQDLQAEQYLRLLSTLIGKIPDETSRATYYSNLAQGWRRLSRWAEAFPAYRDALENGAIPDDIEAGALETLRNLHSVDKVSLIAELMIGREGAPAAARLIVECLPYIRPNYDWALLYNPVRWQGKSRRPWPEAMETLLAALAARPISPADFRNQLWPGMKSFLDLTGSKFASPSNPPAVGAPDLHGSTGPGPFPAPPTPHLHNAFPIVVSSGRANLRAAVEQLGSMYDAQTSPPATPFGPIYRRRDIPPGMRNVLDTTALSFNLSSLDRYYLTQETPDAPAKALWRSAAAWMMDSGNTSSALDTAALLTQYRSDRDIQSASRALRTDLFHVYVKPTAGERFIRVALSALRQDRPVEDFQNDSHLASIYSFLLDGNLTTEERRAIGTAAEHRLRRTKDASPELHLLLGKLAPDGENPERIAEYNAALLDFINQGRVGELPTDLVKTATDDEELRSRQIFPVVLRPGRLGFIFKTPPPPPGAKTMFHVAVEGGKDSPSAQLSEVDPAGLLHTVTFAAPLASGEKVTVTSPQAQIHQVISVQDWSPAAVDPVFDSDGAVTGVANTETELVEVEVTSNDSEARQSVFAIINPFTHKFEAHLRQPLVGGQRIALYGYVGDERRCLLKEEISIARCADDGASVPVQARRPDWGPLRVYVSAGAAITYGNLKDAASPFLRTTFDYNFHTWNTQRLIVRSRNAPGKGFTYLLNGYIEGSLAPLLATAPCLNQTVCRTKLVQPALSNSIGGGLYVPIVPRFMIHEIRGRTNGGFLGPLLKVGLDDIPTLPAKEGTFVDPGHNKPFWAAGIRTGQLRFVSSDSDKEESSALLTYFDVTIGRWDRFAQPAASGIEMPLRFEATGSVKVPRTSVSVGFSTNRGQHADEDRLFINLRLDVGKELAKVRPLLHKQD